MAFTAHNIVLPNGTETFPEIGIPLDQYPWFLAAKRIIRALFPAGVDGVTLVDLGCLEGGYTLEFAKLGMHALGVEIRQSNFDNCNYLKQTFALHNLRYAKDDVWNLPFYGQHQVTFCCGLLYHLDRPRAFLKMLGEQTQRLLIVQTHFAEDVVPEAFSLSPIVEHEGVTGRWYREYDECTTSWDALDQLRWTSWGNSRSFWLTKDSLLQSITDAGFDLLLEQYDGFGSNIVTAMGPDGVYRKLSRGTFLGIKS